MRIKQALFAMLFATSLANATVASIAPTANEIINITDLIVMGVVNEIAEVGGSHRLKVIVSNEKIYKGSWVREGVEFVTDYEKLEVGNRYVFLLQTLISNDSSLGRRLVVDIDNRGLFLPKNYLAEYRIIKGYMGQKNEMAVVSKCSGVPERLLINVPAGRAIELKGYSAKRSDECHFYAVNIEVLENRILELVRGSAESGPKPIE